MVALIIGICTINDHLSLLLTVIHLAGKIIKKKWDIAGGGAQVVAGTEGMEDVIPTNQWLKRVVLPHRVEYMSMPLTAGRRPRTGHEEGAQEPVRFCV